MSVLDRYTDHFVPTYTNFPRGRHISLFILRRIESEAIFRTEGSGEPLTKEFVHLGLDSDDLEQRVVISKRKQTAVERRTGRELLRHHELLGSTDAGPCALNRNNPCEVCLDCMIYGYAAGGGGAQRSRVITDDAFSLHPAPTITATRTFNAPFDDGTPWVRDEQRRMTGLGEDEYVKPEATFLDIETLKDVTADEFRYVVGNVLRSTRYGAISSRIGKVKNTLVATAFSDCELFSNLEWTQQTYDRLLQAQEDQTALDFPLQERVVIAATQEVAGMLQKRVVGRVTFLSNEEMVTLVEEIGDLYSDEEAVKAMLAQTTGMYPPAS